MKKFITVILSLCIAVLLSACGEADEAPSVPKGHLHSPAATPQTVEDPYVGYCGNTRSTVYFKNGKSHTFMYGGSVTLTDILLNLDYSEDALCDCEAEYTVDTEFGLGYEVNLTQSFARFDGGQASLTEDQIKEVRKIINDAEKKA